MNTRAELRKTIDEFLDSDQKTMFIQGTFQREKHLEVMRCLNSHYKNKHILFALNGMDNVSEFTKIDKRVKIGERIQYGNNIYEFAPFNMTDKTSRRFDFAIVYPIDDFGRKRDVEKFNSIFDYINVNKIFYISWTDSVKYDFSFLNETADVHCYFDAEEEDPAYHNRVKKAEQGSY